MNTIIIGNKVNDAFGTGEKMGQQKLWATLSNDLDQGAFDIAGEAGVKARDAANKANADLQKDLKYLDPIFKNAENPTEIYDAIGRDLVNNPRRAAEARSAMGKNAWNQFVDTWVNNAAASSPGTASQVGLFLFCCSPRGTFAGDETSFIRLQTAEKIVKETV